MKLRIWVVLLLAVVMFPLYRATSSKLVDHDVFCMAEVAQLVLDGQPLYGTTWDNKPPLCLLYYAIPQCFQRGSYPALQVEMLVCVTLQAAFFWWGLSNRATWFRLMAAVMAFLLPLLDFSYMWSSSEDLANLLAIPILLGSYRIVTDDKIRPATCLGMGVALTLGFHARQTTILYAALPVLAILMCRDSRPSKIKGLLLGVAGAVIGLAVVVGLILAVGDWRGYLDTVFLAPRKYKGHYWEAIVGLMALREQALLLMLGASTLVVAIRGPHRIFWLTMVALGLATVVLPMRPFAHYWKQLFPILCLMVPEALDRLSAGRTPRVGIAAVLGYLTLNAAMTCGYSGLLRTNIEGHYSRSAADEVAVEIRKAGHPGDTLFVVGPLSAYLHFATDLKPVNRLFWDFFLESNLVELSGAKPDEVFESFRATPPDLLVVEKSIESKVKLGQPTRGRPEFQQLLKDLLESKGYQGVAESGDYRIFRRPDRTKLDTPADPRGQDLDPK